MKYSVFICFFVVMVQSLFAQTIMINEVSQGMVGSQEYVELVVVGTPTCSGVPCLDLRGWYLDDNSGYFASGSGTGIATGCIRFSQNSQWACVPAGSIILIYNSDEYDGNLIPPQDVSDSDGNCVYVLPVSSTLFERHEDDPNSLTSNFPTTGFIPGGGWNNVGMKNGDDSFQVLNPANLSLPVHSVSWGNNINNTIIYFAGQMTALVAYFNNNVSDNYANQANWTTGDAAISQTPGLPNNPDNANWISSMNNNCTAIIPLIANAGPDDQLDCGSSTLQLNGSSSTGNGLSYAWTGPSFLSGQNTATPLIGAAGTYILTIYDTFGCEDSDTVIITVAPAAIANAGPDLLICYGGSVGLSATGGISYLWSNGASSPVTFATPIVTTEYYVTVTTVDGCSDIDTVLVDVSPEIFPQIDAVLSEICAGQTTQLTASGGSDYVWSTGENTASISVTPLAATIYTVTVYNADGCAETATYQISVVDSLMVSLNPSDICAGESTTITASQGDFYLWSTGETTQSISVTPLVSTNYSVTVSNAVCSGTGQATVNVNNLPVGDAGTDQIICAGDSATLLATAGYSYEWNSGSTSQSIIVSPGFTTLFSVTISDGGCSITDQVLVIVSPLPVADAGPDQTICEGEQAQLTASGGTDFLWSNGSTSATTLVSPALTTTYIVTVTLNGCSDTDFMELSITPLPNANAGQDQSICYGENAVLSASGGSFYSWNVGAVGQNITTQPLITTQYIVTVTDNNCSLSDTVVVTVEPQVIASIDATFSVICESQSTGLAATGGNSYIWSTGETSAFIIVSPTETTSYSVTVTQSGCSDSSSIEIHVTPGISIISSPSIICEGDSAVLHVSNGDNYIWSTGDTTQFVTVNPIQTTNYFVTVSNSNCTDSISITVEVSAWPPANAGSDTSLCMGESIVITATGGSNYLWSTSEITASISVAGPLSAMYYVTVSNQNGCGVVDSVFVDVFQLPLAEAGNDQTICKEDSVHLSASGGISYLWSPGFGLQTTNIYNPWASPESSTLYTVIVTNQNGCTSSDNVKINVFPEQYLDLEVLVDPGIEACFGEEITFIATLVDPNVNPVFQWFVNDLNMGNNLPFFASSFLRDGDTVWCMVTSDIECILNNPATDPVGLIIHDAPGIEFYTDRLSDCQPVSLQLAGKENHYYSWTIDGQGTLTSMGTDTVAFVLENPGVYDLMMSVSDSYDCSNDLDYDGFITVYPDPHAEFHVEIDGSDDFQHDVVFLNLSSGGAIDYWDFGDSYLETNFSHESTVHTYMSGGIYTVSLTTETVHGCVDVFETTIQVNDIYTIYAPSAITPEEAQNNVFSIFATGISPDDFKLYIFDRWGETIFEADHLSKGWNGRAKGRRIVPVGVYTWIVYYKVEDTGQKGEKIGTVTVIR